MGYAILRTQKLKSPIAVMRSMKHSFREQDTPNADASRTAENTRIAALNVDEALTKFNERLPHKVRKNGVLAIEYLITGSPEAMNGKSRQEQDAYFRDAFRWLGAKHGAENVVCAGIHRDEITPHMYAYVVPIDNRGKLNCRAFLGGAKALSELQTAFATDVGIKHALQRGLEGSRARHTQIREYYGRVQAATLKTPSIDVPEAKLLEGKEKYGHRVAKAVIEQIAPELISWRAKGHHTDLAYEQLKVARVRLEQAEFRESQTENARRSERSKTVQAVEKLKEMMLVVARGGEPLAKLQAQIAKGAEQERERSKGRSR